MLPGRTKILKCSTCSKPIAQDTIMSGNTFGARFWTDGKREAPMLPDEPWLVKCPHCLALLWIDEQEEVGESDPWADNGHTSSEFKDALPFTTPSFEEYIIAIGKGVSDNNKLRYLRLRAWWAGNDERRETPDPAPLSEEETANLRAFVALLDESDENECVMKAEALRELGEYDQAKILLSQQFSSDLIQAATIIRNLAAQRISFVQEIDFP